MESEKLKELTAFAEQLSEQIFELNLKIEKLSGAKKRNTNNRREDITKLLNICFEHYGIEVSDMDKAGMRNEVSAPKMIFTKICYDDLRMSYREIASFYNKDRTTSNYFYNKCQEQLKIYKYLKNDYDTIKKAYNQSLEEKNTK